MLAAVACTDDPAETRAVEPEPFTYVAVGASDSVGIGAANPQTEAWTAQFHEALHDKAMFVNLGVSGSTVKAALEAQLPKAIEAKPELVTVWLAVNDIVRLVSPEDYERDLDTLVAALRQGGRAEVLVANAPPIEKLPSIRACLTTAPKTDGCRLPVRVPESVVTARVDAFNDAIARVVERHGAVLIDLHRSAVASFDGALVAADGFHPSTEGHQRIAAVFALAIPPKFARTPGVD